MKERNSNIEVLRMIAMMAVIALHYVHVNIGGVERYAEYPNFAWFFVNAIRSLAIPFVNVFVIITGFYSINQNKYTFRKTVNLLVITVFYGIIVYFVSCIVDNRTIVVKELIKKALSIFFGSSWFIRSYLVLLLISPFLNIVLSSINRSSYQKLVVIQLLVFSVLYSLGLSSPIEDDGYGIINFVTLYILGGYINRFEISIALKKLSSIKLFCYYCLCALITFISSYFINPFGYAFITNIVGAVLLFLTVSRLKPKYNKYINRVSANTFDVFFTHEHLFPLFQIGLIGGSLWLIPHIAFTVISCYLIGCFIGFIRRKIFEISIDKVLDLWESINKVFYIN